jgi:ABC-2 type transport system ATP-binding protein
MKGTSVTSESYAIQVQDLTKRYGPSEGGVLALDGISFEVPAGAVFGYLGPNGAGKTTTIRLLTGLSQPTSGQAHVLGLDVTREAARVKKRIGVVPEASNLYNELTCYDNLVFSMQLYGVPRAEREPRAMALLQRFRLRDKRDVPFAKLSRGMKRALTIAAALAHRPAVVFLDEPTTGLDVIAARGLRQMIAGLRDEGVTVLLTTHYLEEAERLCDRIAIIVGGRIVADDTLDGLKALLQGETAVELVLGNGDEPAETRRIVADDVQAAVRKGLDQAAAEERRVLAVNTVRPSLEDVFVRLTGLSADAMRTEKAKP